MNSDVTLPPKKRFKFSSFKDSKHTSERKEMVLRSGRRLNYASAQGASELTSSTLYAASRTGKHSNTALESSLHLLATAASQAAPASEKDMFSDSEMEEVIPEVIPSEAESLSQTVVTSEPHMNKQGVAGSRASSPLASMTASRAEGRLSHSLAAAHEVEDGALLNSERSLEGASKNREGESVKGGQLLAPSDLSDVTAPLARETAPGDVAGPRVPGTLTYEQGRREYRLERVNEFCQHYRSGQLDRSKNYPKEDLVYSLGEFEKAHALTEHLNGGRAIWEKYVLLYKMNLSLRLSIVEANLASSEEKNDDKIKSRVESISYCKDALGFLREAEKLSGGENLDSKFNRIEDFADKSFTNLIKDLVRNGKWSRATEWKNNGLEFFEKCAGGKNCPLFKATANALDKELRKPEESRDSRNVVLQGRDRRGKMQGQGSRGGPRAVGAGEPFCAKAGRRDWDRRKMSR